MVVGHVAPEAYAGGNDRAGAGRRLDHDRRAHAAAAAERRRRRARAPPRRAGARRRRATRAACWPSSRRTRRARAAARCSTATSRPAAPASARSQRGSALALLRLRLAARARVHAERPRGSPRAGRLLLVFHPLHLAALVEAGLVGPDPPEDRRARTARRTSRGRRRTPSSSRPNGPMSARLRHDQHDADDDEQHDVSPEGRGPAAAPRRSTARAAFRYADGSRASSSFGPQEPHETATLSSLIVIACMAAAPGVGQPRAGAEEELHGLPRDRQEGDRPVLQGRRRQVRRPDRRRRQAVAEGASRAAPASGARCRCRPIRRSARPRRSSSCSGS